MIKSEFGLVHLSTGDILRAAVQAGTPLGVKAKGFMDAGQLVPDELIIDVICARLKEPDCQTNGWLLDGFPRTKSQADALTAAGMVPDCFVMLDVPEDVLVERVTGRRTDPVTGKIYHLTFKPPESPEVAARLVQRSDDTAEKIRVRYREFQSHIAAVEGTYADKMVRVDGARAATVVSDAVVDALDDVVLAKRKTDPRAVPASLEVAVVSQNVAPADAFCGASALVRPSAYWFG
jgi:adenylate kinase